MAFTDEERVMGYHLLADVLHDFGASAPLYNIGKEAAKKVNATSTRPTTEDEAVKFFIAGEGGDVVVDRDARANNRKIFPIPYETSTFANWIPPLIYDAGNDNVGIVQDAGKFITEYLKCKNVITFGSILDPAGKPDDRNAIWFDPGEATSLQIPLRMFGFEPEVIEALRVEGLKYASVKAGFVMKGQLIDGVTMNNVNVQTGALRGEKPINIVEVARAGYFTSIGKATTVEQHIGKTLGDVTLVASAMPAFGTVPNSYYGVGAAAEAGEWKEWAADWAAVPPPQVLMLKTGDRLNWVRAVVMNVGAIYEDQPKGDREIKQFDFFPGTVDPAAIEENIREKFGTLAEEVAARYNGLIASLEALPLSDVTFDGSTKALEKEIGQQLGARFIAENIRPQLEFLRNRIVAWVGRRSEIKTTNIDSLRAYYEETRIRANACSPPASVLVNARGKLLPKIIVTNVPPSGATEEIDWPVHKSLSISLADLFVRFNRGDTNVGGTNIVKQFLRYLPKPQEQTGGGEDDSDPTDVEAYARAVTGEVGTYTAGKVTWKEDTNVNEVYTDHPFIYEFILYCWSVIGDEALDIVVNTLSSPFYGEDIDVWNVAQSEARSFISNLTAEPPLLEDDGRTRKGTVLFNAYVQNLNARNTCFVDVDGATEETDNTSDFDLYEAAFLMLATGEDINSAKERARHARELRNTTRTQRAFEMVAIEEATDDAIEERLLEGRGKDMDAETAVDPDAQQRLRDEAADAFRMTWQRRDEAAAAAEDEVGQGIGVDGEGMDAEDAVKAPAAPARPVDLARARLAAPATRTALTVDAPGAAVPWRATLGVGVPGNVVTPEQTAERIAAYQASFAPGYYSPAPAPAPAAAPRPALPPFRLGPPAAAVIPNNRRPLYVPAPAPAPAAAPRPALPPFRLGPPAAAAPALTFGSWGAAPVYYSPVAATAPVSPPSALAAGVPETFMRGESDSVREEAWQEAREAARRARFNDPSWKQNVAAEDKERARLDRELEEGIQRMRAESVAKWRQIPEKRRQAQIALDNAEVAKRDALAKRLRQFDEEWAVIGPQIEASFREDDEAASRGEARRRWEASSAERAARDAVMAAYNKKLDVFFRDAQPIPAAAPKPTAAAPPQYVMVGPTTARTAQRVRRGGLRNRRPLYSNASESSDGSDGDEGLRERRRTRRSSRVRQRPHQSRTRRQRDNMDRV